MKPKYISLVVDKNLHALVKKAATLEKRSIRSFVRVAMEKDAHRVIDASMN